MSGPSEAAIKAAKQAATQNARGRGFRGNDLEAWAIHSDSLAAVTAAHAVDEPRIRAEQTERIVGALEMQACRTQMGRSAADYIRSAFLGSAEPSPDVLREALVRIARLPHSGTGDSREVAAERGRIARGALFTTPIASCMLCGASWAMPRDEPHDCAVRALHERVEALEAQRAEALSTLNDPLNDWVGRVVVARHILSGERGD